jgi:hypothetical protein
VAIPVQPFNQKDENLCEYTGLFGILLSLTCLIQHFVVTRSLWITQLMTVGYIFAIIVFLLLALKKPAAPVLLIISAVFSFITQIIWVKGFAFSLVVLLLVLYTAVAVVVLYVEQLPQKLKQKRLAEKEEEELWVGKI